MTAVRRLALALCVLCLPVVPMAVAASDLAPQKALRPVARGQIVKGVILPADVFVQRDLTSDLAADAAAKALSGSRAPERPETLGLTRFMPDPLTAISVSMRPKLRPATVMQQARAADAKRQRGAVCGDIALQGVEIGRVEGTSDGCGVADAVRLQSVSGVPLSTHAVMDCPTARALKRWVDTGLQPAVKGYGGGVKELRVAAHYACRPRNNRKGAKLSEHGRGKAIDIAAIRLMDGRDLVVLDDWTNGREGRILHRVHDAACGPFGTVLGPDADAMHRDHLHLDTASYRSGPYCK